MGRGQASQPAVEDVGAGSVDVAVVLESVVVVVAAEDDEVGSSEALVSLALV